MQPDASKSTVFFDGSCPFCQAEIGHYRRQDDSGVLCFVDVSKTVETLPANLSQQKAWQGFMFLPAMVNFCPEPRPSSESGVCYRRRWAARTAALPGAMTALELGYRLYLRCDQPSPGYSGYFRNCDSAPTEPYEGDWVLIPFPQRAESKGAGLPEERRWRWFFRED